MCERKVWIYFLKKSDTEGVKIGRTNNVKRRLRELQTASSEKLDFIFYFQAKNVSAEKMLHLYFSDRRLRGEWFDIDDSDFEYIKDIKWRNAYGL